MGFGPHLGCVSPLTTKAIHDLNYLHLRLSSAYFMLQAGLEVGQADTVRIRTSRPSLMFFTTIT